MSNIFSVLVKVIKKNKKKKPQNSYTSFLFKKGKNFCLSSRVGSQHSFFLPNHLYLFLPTQSYTIFLKKLGIIMKLYARNNGNFNFLAICKAALLLIKISPLSYRIIESIWLFFCLNSVKY